MEILISMPLLAFMSLALVSVLLYASRMSRIVTYQIAAKNIAQSYLERMAIDDFADVTPANYPSVTKSTSPPLYLDLVSKTRCEVDIRITGYGEAESGSANSLTDNEADWVVNEWVGDTLFLVGGTSRGQRAQITGNTTQTLTVDTTLLPAPTSTTLYLINGGKTVRIVTRWTYMGKLTESDPIETLVIDWGPRR